MPLITMTFHGAVSAAIVCSCLGAGSALLARHHWKHVQHPHVQYASAMPCGGSDTTALVPGRIGDLSITLGPGVATTPAIYPGTQTVASVPEANAFVLLATALGLMAIIRRFKR